MIDEQEKKRRVRYLSRYRWAVEMLREKEYKLEAYTGVKAIQYNDMPKGSGGGEDLTEVVADRIRREGERDEAAKEVGKAAREVERAIDTLDNPVARQMLTMRFVGMKHWEQIEETMNRSASTRKRIVAEAIEKIKIPDGWE